MTSRIRRLELAYDSILPDGIQHDTPHTLDRSEIMRGASRQGSEITYTLQGQVRTAPRQTEVDGLKAAAGLIEPEEPAPLIDTPNRYVTRRPCTCKHHEGNKWRPITEFSERKAKNGKMYPQSWCKACTARYVRDQYHGLNKRMA